MAKIVAPGVIIFDAINQGEGFGPNEDGVSVVLTRKFVVATMSIANGANAGTVTLDSRQSASSGDHDKYTWFSEPIGANEERSFNFAGGRNDGLPVEGAFTTSFPTGCKVTLTLG